MKQRSREEVATLRNEVIKYREENPEMSVKEISAHFNIKPFYFYYLTKKSAGERKKKTTRAAHRSVEESPTPDLSDIADAPTVSNLIKRIEEVLKFSKEVLAAQQERAKQLFL